MARPKTDTDAARKDLIDAAEYLLARHGPGKVTVSDVAARCRMSQSNAYRFFPSKAALLQGVAARWFLEVETALRNIAHKPIPAKDALSEFLLCQLRLKRRRFDANPELFRAYLELAEQNMDAVQTHVRDISRLLQLIVSRWLEENGLAEQRVERITRIVEDATILFRDPNLIARRRAECSDARARAVIDAVLRGVVHSEEKAGHDG